MQKNCYIFWDDDSVPETERKIYVQCEECFKKNGKGFKWDIQLLYGKNVIKCNFCDTIIYKRKRKKKGINDEDKTVD